MNAYSDQLGILLKMQIWIQQVWSVAWDSEFPASSQKTQMVLVRGLQFQQQSAEKQTCWKYEG